MRKVLGVYYVFQLRMIQELQSQPLDSLPAFGDLEHTMQHLQLWKPCPSAIQQYIDMIIFGMSHSE